MLYKLIAIVVVFSVVANADPIPFKDCGSSSGITGATMDISGCSKLPCVFYLNSNVTATISFKTLQPYKLITNIVYGIIAGVKVPFPLPQADACKNGIPCPLEANHLYQETIVLPILQEYPQISLYAQFQLDDENSNTVMCAYFPAKITKQ